MQDYMFRQVRADDLSRCYQIESTAYDGDEAATEDKIATRIAHYPQGFLVLEVDGQVIGFINSGCADQVAMSDTAFKELVGHDAAAPNVVIMSVVLDPAWQGKGYASKLMAAFVESRRAMGKQAIYLVCKDKHVALYRRFGFSYLSPSDASYGGASWHEMVMTL